MVKTISQLINTNYRIIQYSPTRTASTVLCNILYGLYYDNHKVVYADGIQLSESLNSNFIIKTHCLNTNIDEIISSNLKYKLFFIVSERPEINQIIDNKYKNYNNVLRFSYTNELNETPDFPISNIVINVNNKLKQFLPKKIHPIMPINNAINRIIDMNKLYSQIKNESFDFIDDYYHIHGSHRNRG